MAVPKVRFVPQDWALARDTVVAVAVVIALQTCCPSTGSSTSSKNLPVLVQSAAQLSAQATALVVPWCRRIVVVPCTKYTSSLETCTSVTGTVRPCPVISLQVSSPTMTYSVVVSWVMFQVAWVRVVPVLLVISRQGWISSIPSPAVMITTELINSSVVQDLVASTVVVRAPVLASAVPRSPLIHTWAALPSLGLLTMYSPCL